MKKVKAKKATDTEVKVEIKTAAEVKAFEECKELYEQSGASEFFNFTTYLPIMKWLGFTDFKITDDITDQKLINAYSSFANSKFETPSVEKYGLEKLADIVESRRLSEKDEVEQNLKILKSLDSQRSTRTNAIKNKDSKEGKEKLKRIENDTEYFRLSQRITGLQNKLTLCEIKETLSKRIEEIVEAEQRQEEIELQKHKKDSEDQLYVGGKKPFSDGSSQPTSKLDNKEQEQTPTKEPKTDQARLNTNSSDAFSEEKGVATQADSATQAQTSANEIHKEPDSKSTLEDFGRNANDPELRIESGDPDLSDDVVLKTQSPAKESEIQVEANKALLTLQSLEKHNKGQNSKYQRDDDAQSQDSRAEEVLEENKGGRPDYNLDLTSYMQDDIQGGESPLLKSKFPEGNYEAQVGANLPEHKTVKRGGNEDYGANNQMPAGSLLLVSTPEKYAETSSERLKTNKFFTLTEEKLKELKESFLADRKAPPYAQSLDGVLTTGKKIKEEEGIRPRFSSWPYSPIEQRDTQQIEADVAKEISDSGLQRESSEKRGENFLKLNKSRGVYPAIHSRNSLPEDGDEEDETGVGQENSSERLPPKSQVSPLSRSFDRGEGSESSSDENEIDDNSNSVLGGDLPIVTRSRSGSESSIQSKKEISGLSNKRNIPLDSIVLDGEESDDELQKESSDNKSQTEDDSNSPSSLSTLETSFFTELIRKNPKSTGLKIPRDEGNGKPRHDSSLRQMTRRLSVISVHTTDEAIETSEIGIKIDGDNATPPLSSPSSEEIRPVNIADRGNRLDESVNFLPVETPNSRGLRAKVKEGYDIIEIGFSDGKNEIAEKRFYAPLKEVKLLNGENRSGLSIEDHELEAKMANYNPNEEKIAKENLEIIRNQCGFKVKKESKAAEIVNTIDSRSNDAEKNVRKRIDLAIVEAAEDSGLKNLASESSIELSQLINFAIEFARTNNGFGTRKNDGDNKIDLFFLAIDGLEESNPLRNYCASAEERCGNLFKVMKKFSRDFQDNMKNDGFLTAREGERAKIDVGMRLKKLSESYFIDEAKIREVEEVIAAELSSGKRFPSPSPRPVLSGDISRRGGSMNGKGL